MKLLQMVRQVISHISKEWTMSIIHYELQAPKKEVDAGERYFKAFWMYKKIYRNYYTTTDPFLSVKAEFTFHLSVDRHGSSKQIGEKTHFQTPSTHKEID